MSEEDKMWIMKQIKRLEEYICGSERSLKKHITTKVQMPRKVIKYFAQNIELDEDLNEIEDESDIRVTGIKLKMREIACTLIDDYNAVPVRAADAVFLYFDGMSGAYDKRLSFRTTVYKHYLVSRGCKPVRKSNMVKDLNELRKIITTLV